MSGYTGLEIAVIGMSARFPGAQNINEYWENLKNGIESVVSFSAEDAVAEGEQSVIANKSNYVKANSFIEGKEYFDAKFFNYAPYEAELMDPQIRVFHECCWNAIEDAGYNVRTDIGKVGLFAGASDNMNWKNYAQIKNTNQDVDAFTFSLLTNTDFMNTRVSYLLNLKGPSVFVQSACSTSLLAVQKACSSLLLRECRLALAGGVTVRNYSRRGYLHFDGMVQSQDGHCRPFDKDASGFIAGEGAGVVVLKRLKDAIEDRDNIYAVIKGIGINNDGNEKIGYTAPSVSGQSKAISLAHKTARIDPSTIGYIETHGTATELGDVVEISALEKAFRNSGIKHCPIGSVKANIGHLDSAAGIASFIKTVLVLKNKQLPPTINYNIPNPKIKFESLPFYVNDTLKEFELNSPGIPRRAGVSSFGIGGTNVHAVLEEAPKIENRKSSQRYHILPFSAPDGKALLRNCDTFGAFLQKEVNLDIADTAYTLQKGRTQFDYRKTLICSDKSGALEALLAEKKKPKAVMKNPRVSFMFSGLGSQYDGMAKDLYRYVKEFRSEADKCIELLNEITQSDYKEKLFGDHSTKDESFKFVQYQQFVLEYSLAKMLMNWGLKPDKVIGYSFGEYVAACIAGVFDLRDVLQLLYIRQSVLAGIENTSLLSIPLNIEEVNGFLPDSCQITIDNGDSCVVTGSKADISLLEKSLLEKRILATRIDSQYPIHSNMLLSVVDTYAEQLSRIKIRKPQIPIISNVTGDVLTEIKDVGVKYWCDHLTKMVQFDKSIRELVKDKNQLFIEIGPGYDICSLFSRYRNKDNAFQCFNLVRPKSNDEADDYYLFSKLGKIWAAGAEFNLSELYANETRKTVSLPGYSFERTEYAATVDAYKMISKMISANSNSKKDNIADWLYEYTWKLSPRSNKFLKTDETKCNLLLLNEGWTAKLLIRKFKEYNENVVCVYAGNSFVKTKSGFTVDPASYDDFKKLTHQLQIEGTLPNRIIHCWGVAESRRSDLFDCSEEYIHTVYYSLVNLIKALHENGGVAEIDISVLTNGLHELYDDNAIDPLKSLMQGLLKVIPQEYPNISSCHIDVSSTEKYSSEIENNLFEDILSEQPGKIITYRENKRWEKIYNRLIIEPEKQFAYKTNGTYLITGGLGSLGYTIAKYLLTRYAANVILLGRSRLPENTEAVFQMADGTQSETLKHKILRLQELQGCNGQVVYFNCNIADRSELSIVLKKSRENFVKIDGVFHTAGVIGDDAIRLLSQCSAEDFQIQFESKLHGIVALHKELKDEPDFCLVTSSLSAILGGLGFSAYASANAFMNYYIKNIRSKGGKTNWVSLNLDGLNLDDSDTELINADEIIELLYKALTVRGMSEITVSTTDLIPRLRDWVFKSAGSDSVSEQIKENELVQAHFSENEPFSLEDKLMALWNSFFGEEVGVKDDFFELGADSLKALNMIRLIQRKLSIQLSVDEFFKNPSISKLRTYIEKRQASVARTGGQNSEVCLSDSYGKPVRHFFIEKGEDRIYSVYNPAKTDSVLDVGVILISPFGQEYIRCFSIFNELTKQFNEKGVDVFRFDYVGTGNSSGDFSDLSIKSSLKDIEQAITAFKEISGCERICLVGVRMGASLSMLSLLQKDVDQLVLWSPVSNGKEYLDEIELEYRTWIDGSFTNDKKRHKNTTQSQGFLYSAELTAEIKNIRLSAEDLKIDKPVLIINANVQAEIEQLANVDFEAGINEEFWVKREDESGKALFPDHEMNCILNRVIK